MSAEQAVSDQEVWREAEAGILGILIWRPDPHWSGWRRLKTLKMNGIG
jgi:hypothetical protein